MRPHRRSWFPLSAVVLFLAAVPGAAQTDNPQIVPQEGTVVGEQSPPATPLTKKALQKKIKDAEAKAKRAGHNASHQNRVADQLAKQKRDEEAAFARKVANGFLRERGEALYEAAEAKRQLADLKAGRKPQPSTPVADKEPVPPTEPVPGAPGEPPAGGPETSTKPAPGVPGAEKPATPPEPPKPADPAGKPAIKGSLQMISDPDTHPHTLCQRIALLPVIGIILANRRLQLRLGDEPPLECPWDCGGPEDELCEGECMGDLPYQGQRLKVKLEIRQVLLRDEPAVPALTNIPILGKIFFRFGKQTDADPPLVFFITPRIIGAEP
jgi:hypothetical protein